MYKVPAEIQRDIFIIYAKHSGLHVWRSSQKMFDDKMRLKMTDEELDEEKDKSNKVSLPDDYKPNVAGEVNYIKATPNGKFIITGYAHANKILFFKFDEGEITMTPILQPIISVSFFNAFLSNLIFQKYRSIMIHLKPMILWR
jgi:hypothetical protein